MGIQNPIEMDHGGQGDAPHGQNFDFLLCFAVRSFIGGFVII